MSEAFVHSVAMMGTVVTIQVVGHGADEGERAERAEVVDRSVEWFRRIEECCSRFDPQSEVRQLAERVGESVAVSPMLFEAVQFALALAEETDGAFDPTVGQRMEARGFDRDYRTGQRTRSAAEEGGDVSYRDVRLDHDAKTITLARPLVLDLGAVAKGLAIDMAACELAAFQNFAIDAGGDLYLGGCNAAGTPWAVGLRHPRDEHELIETLHVSNAAVCTSGDYERRVEGASESEVGGHHIMDPRTGKSANAVASVTVTAPLALVADGLATAAFVLGPTLGLELLERHGVSGLIVTPTLERFATRDV